MSDSDDLAGSGDAAVAIYIREEKQRVVLDALELEGVRIGERKTKGWVLRHRTWFAAQRDRGGALAKVERTLERDRDWYTETVTMHDTGEVVHHCSEPLSEHRGRGSARRRGEGKPRDGA